jgi:hypothetical protein
MNLGADCITTLQPSVIAQVCEEVAKLSGGDRLKKGAAYFANESL